MFVSPEMVIAPAPSIVMSSAVVELVESSPWVRLSVPDSPVWKVIASDSAFALASVIASRKVQPPGSVVQPLAAASVSVLTAKFWACAAAGANANAPIAAPATRPPRRSRSC